MGQYSDLNMHNGDLALISKMHATHSKWSNLRNSSFDVFVMTKHIQPCKNIQVWLINEKYGLYSFWQGLRKM